MPIPKPLNRRPLTGSNAHVLDARSRADMFLILHHFAEACIAGNKETLQHFSNEFLAEAIGWDAQGQL
jgi:hypothetical protein